MEYDVVVAGSGAAGSAAAWRLATSGLRVACVERGDWQDPTTYPSTALDWEIKKAGPYSYRPSVRNLASDYRIDTTESDIEIANFNGVGGATILFSGHFLRMHPSDFRARSLDGVGEDWPLSYRELEPYYDLNDRMMRVSGLAGDPAYPEMHGLPGPIPIGRYGEAIARGFNKLGWHWWPSYAAIASGPRAQAPCLNLGPCNTGCPQGAKSSTDVTYIPAALRAGLDLFTNTTVHGIEVSARDAVEGVWLRSGTAAPRLVAARAVVLACNAVGTARLLLSCRSRRHPDGLANSSGLVGRNLMLHPLGYAEGLFDSPTDVDRGPQGCCIYSHEFYETSAQRPFKRGYTLHVLRGGGLLDTALTGLDRRQARWGAGLVRDVIGLHRRRASITVICEDLPEPENRVTLSEQLDRDGMPIVKVTYRVDGNTKAMMSHGLTQAKQVLQASGLRNIMAFGPIRDTGWHLMGTARMGSDPGSSVVDRTGEAHDVRGLFVADGSVFPTAGGVNPASTIQAVALHVADRVRGRLGRGPVPAPGER